VNRKTENASHHDPTAALDAVSELPEEELIRRAQAAWTQGIPKAYRQTNKATLANRDGSALVARPAPRPEPKPLCNGALQSAQQLEAKSICVVRMHAPPPPPPPKTAYVPKGRQKRKKGKVKEAESGL